MAFLLSFGHPLAVGPWVGCFPFLGFGFSVHRIGVLKVDGLWALF